MAFKNQEVSTVFYANNKTPSPNHIKPRGKSAFYSHSRGKLQLDFSQGQFDKFNQRGKPGSGGQAVTSPNRVSPNGRNRPTPSKERSPRLSPSPGELYAGFTESPAPAALPKPPSDWVVPLRMASGRSFERPELTESFRMFLNVQA